MEYIIYYRAVISMMMSPVLKFVNSSKALKFKRLEKKHISSNKKNIRQPVFY